MLLFQQMALATETRLIKLAILIHLVNLPIMMNLYLTSSNKRNKIVYLDKIEAKLCSGTDNMIN